MSNPIKFILQPIPLKYPVTFWKHNSTNLSWCLTFGHLCKLHDLIRIFSMVYNSSKITSLFPWTKHLYSSNLPMADNHSENLHSNIISITPLFYHSIHQLEWFLRHILFVKYLEHGVVGRNIQRYPFFRISSARRIAASTSFFLQRVSIRMLCITAFDGTALPSTLLKNFMASSRLPALHYPWIKGP